MNYYEKLAKAIFDHECSGPDCPLAPWDQQPNTIKAPYVKAAQVAIIVLHEYNEFVVSMVDKLPETAAQ